MRAFLPAAWLRGFLFAGRWVLVMAVLFGVVAPARALIEGGEGNEAIRDPGWPAGAAAVFNFKGRVAHWVGPPFGGGEWHADCRGNAEDLNAILAAFDRIDAKNKKVIVHDGTGNSFWLNINREPAKREAAKIDWMFTVWQKENFDRLAKMPPDLRRISESDLRLGPPTTLDIYTGGSVKWADVLMPKGLTVIDKRLEAHGFKLSDGVVLEGKFVDLDLKKPVAGKLRLELVEPQKAGGYKYSVVKEVASDKNGRWVVKNAPEGWLRLVAVADGYVSRVIGYEKFDGEPRWASYDCGLLCPAPVTGRVVDAEGKPLAGVEVQFGDVATKQIGRYESLKKRRECDDRPGRAISHGEFARGDGFDLGSQAGLRAAGVGEEDHDADEGCRVGNDEVSEVGSGRRLFGDNTAAGIHREDRAGRGRGRRLVGWVEQPGCDE